MYCNFRALFGIFCVSEGMGLWVLFNAYKYVKGRRFLKCPRDKEMVYV